MSGVNWVNFGYEMKAARSLLGLSREALAKAINLAPATIARLEDGTGDVGSGNAGIVVQTLLERSGIEFIEGTTGVAVALRTKPGEQVTEVAVTIDPSMPSGTRFIWPRSSICG